MHWLGRHRLLVLAFICFFWTGVIFLGHFFPGVPFISAPWRGEQSFEDLLRREGRKTAGAIRFCFSRNRSKHITIAAVDALKKSRAIARFS